LFVRNHSAPGTVNSWGTPFYFFVSGPIWRNIAQLSHLIVRRTNGRKALVPQRHVARNFCRYSCEELRRWRGIGLDETIGVVVPEHLTSAGKRKRLKRYISVVEDLECLRVGCIGEECGAKRMEDASEWIVSRRPKRPSTFCCVTLTRRCTTTGTFLPPLPGCQRSWLLCPSVRAVQPQRVPQDRRQ
jgi:hypothetical protein